MVALESIGGSEGEGAKDALPTLGPISFISMQFSVKILSNNRFLPEVLPLCPGTKTQPRNSSSN